MKVKEKSCENIHVKACVDKLKECSIQNNFTKLWHSTPARVKNVNRPGSRTRCENNNELLAPWKVASRFGWMEREQILLHQSPPNSMYFEKKVDLIQTFKFSPNLIQVRFQIQIFPPFQSKHPSLDLNFSMLGISMTSDDGENQKRIVMSSL